MSRSGPPNARDLAMSAAVDHRQDRLRRSRIDTTDQGLSLLIGIGLVVAVVNADALLSGLLSVALAIVLVSWYYKRFAGSHLQVSVRARPRRIFPGQPTELRVEVRNPARLPLPWLRVFVHLARRIKVEEMHVELSPIDAVMPLPFSLGGRQVVERKVTATLEQRGLHQLGPADAWVSDPFGLQEVRRTDPETSPLLVYPRLHAITADLQRTLPIGDRRGHSFLDEETHYLGPRAYQPTDPLRRIDWRQSARRGELHVKTYETVATAATALFLDPTTARLPWEGIDVEVLERTVEITASIASDLIKRGQAVGLYVTGVFSAVAGRRAFSYRERPRTGARQLSRLLEALAQLRPPGLFRDLPRIMIEEVPRLPYHVHVVTIAPYLTKDLQLALLRASRSHKTYFLQTGEADPEQDAQVPPGVRPLHVRAT